MNSIMVIATLSFFLFYPQGKAEVFTALTHMEGLVNMEQKLLNALNSYITSEKERLKKLERFADTVDGALQSTGEDVSRYLHDPVNAFKLVNRYNQRWRKLHKLVYVENGQDLIANISMNKEQFPSQEDVDGAIVALLRLQDTYSLEPGTMACGKLGSTKGLSMSSKDCFTIGRYAYNQKDWIHTRQWMVTALERFDEKNDTSLDVASVYDHLAFAEYSLGNLRKAARYNRDLLQHDPHHERALNNLKYFDYMALNEPDKFIDGEKEQEEVVNQEHAKYEQLCREPLPIPSHLHKKLLCYYYNNNRNPRLVLAPIKTEVAFVEPKIYLFHDFVSEREIERLKELAIPRLRRATAWSNAAGRYVTVDYRISKSGWLSPSDDPLGYVQRIDQRIEDLTGLDMSTAEQLQVVNYGIGGHYEPHYDFSSTGVDDLDSLGTQDRRISTLLIYLSDVEIGGATVFPQVGARITPQKGSASYWWNLKKSGRGDYTTRHAGCPVLVGSKWVCNKWIHERGQEFRRPCGLSPDE